MSDERVSPKRVATWHTPAVFALVLVIGALVIWNVWGWISPQEPAAGRPAVLVFDADAALQELQRREGEGRGAVVDRVVMIERVNQAVQIISEESGLVVIKADALMSHPAAIDVTRDAIELAGQLGERGRE